MSRPLKNGLDYFSMDVITDDKFELIEARHGLIGFAIIIKLFQKIYKEGYYLDWNEDKLLLFRKTINENVNLINAVIKDCLRYNIFDQSLFEKYKILTSSGIQKRYLAACERRRCVNLNKNYIIVGINLINVNINWIDVDISTQSKVKETKAESETEKNGKKKFIPPSLEEVKKYFSENGYLEETAERFYKGYAVAEWKDTKGNKIHVWKQKAQQVWFKPENKINGQQKKEHSPYADRSKEY